MKKDNNSFCSRSSVAALVIVLIIYSLLSIYSHQHTRLTADTMLYFSLAQKYVSGDLINAVNGYWGPLLAWLLVPFLFFGISDITAINTLDLIIGILTIYGVWVLSFKFELTEKIRSVMLLALCPIVLRFSIVQPMDFLLLCLLVYYLCIIFDPDYSNRPYHGMFSGVLGALAYLTKAYALPFFIVHFLGMSILHYFKDPAKRNNILKSAVAGFILFSLISGAWIVTISDKYDHFTFSTMTKTNFNSPGPDAMGGGLEFGVPVFYKGLYAPPNETAFVVWEDPSNLEGHKWSPFDSWSYFKHFIKLILKNIAEGLLIFESFSTLSVVIVIAYLLSFLAQPKGKPLSRENLLYTLFTIALFTGGYLLFHLEQRYLWLVNILLLLMGCQVLSDLFKKDFFESNLRKNILVAVFIVSFIFTPSRHILQASKYTMDQYMYYVSTDLEKYNIKGNIASSREYVPVHDSWHKTFRLAYWLGGRYYGQVRDMISDKELESDLKEHNIEYYFQWSESENNSHFLSQFKELTNGEIPGLKIYSLKEKRH